MSGSEQPSVEVRDAPEESRWEAWIGDRLAGFAAYELASGETSRIVFTHTEVDDAYEGHGIGLSVCKKIVERHGGRIAARPPEGPRGTRIVFTLPAVAAASRAADNSGA